MGGGQITGDPSALAPAPLSRRDFFPVGLEFGPLPLDHAVILDLKSAETLALSGTYRGTKGDELRQMRWRAAEAPYLFSANLNPP